MLAYLSRKAFIARIPFPLVHIDTGHNFPETMEYRDWLINELGVQLVVGSVQEILIKRGWKKRVLMPVQCLADGNLTDTIEKQI